MSDSRTWIQEMLAHLKIKSIRERIILLIKVHFQIKRLPWDMLHSFGDWDCSLGICKLNASVSLCKYFRWLFHILETPIKNEWAHSFFKEYQKVWLHIHNLHISNDASYLIIRSETLTLEPYRNIIQNISLLERQDDLNWNISDRL